MSKILLTLWSMAFIIFGYGISHADSWVAFDCTGWADEKRPQQMIFTLTDNQLSLNTFWMSTSSVGSSGHYWRLFFSGSWAVCGTIDGSDNLIPDPYATFIQLDMSGYISWATDTPIGYTAPLMLGYTFYGNGAHTYKNQKWGNDEVTGTLVVWDTCPLYGNQLDFYTPLSHVFYASNVPEPSGLLLMMSGLISGGFVLLRTAKR